ncbi:MAG TPA: aminotransferase class V-fold PLP-dependent enzyme [Bryobacteraceae bacterium]|jgi:glutamate/tyrosine decarboxylase-like PLP-dependent enzyme|nr:aminotransferase class V-fold PLP-dependent enzyme [Bryobacteraceae bacterium]
MRNLLQSAAARASRYLEDIQERRVRPSEEGIRGLDQFREPMPESGADPEEVLSILDDFGSPGTMGCTGPRFFGFVIGGALPAAVASSWMASAWDQCASRFASSPVSMVLEEVSLAWLTDILGLPPGCGAGFVTGGTMANFTALAAARHSVLERAGWDVERDGLFDAPKVEVVVGGEVHPSLSKALGMLGMGRERVTSVPVDNQGRMIAGRFPNLRGPAIVCLQAGNVNTGAFDPAREIIAKAHAAGAWVHVDGAFGLWAAASPALRHLVDGCDGADSWATDAHKWLNVPYDSGLAFVRDPRLLRAAMSIEAPYLPVGANREPSQYTPELSRRARGVDIWAALKSLGRSGVAELIERNCRSASRFASGLAEVGFEILNDVVLNQVLVSFGSPEDTKAIIEGIQAEGTCWCGPTEWQGRTAMRISVCSWRTTEEDVERSLAAILQVAEAVLSRK